MTDDAIVTHVSVSSSKQYKIGGFGIVALQTLLDPGYRVSIRDLRSGDRVTLTVILEGVTAVRVDLPAGFLEPIE